MRRAQTLTVEDWMASLGRSRRAAVGGMTSLTYRRPRNSTLAWRSLVDVQDGFHNLVTIFQAIDIATPWKCASQTTLLNHRGLAYPVPIRLSTQDNLVVKAVDSRPRTRPAAPSRSRSSCARRSRLPPDLGRQLAMRAATLVASTSFGTSASRFDELMTIATGLGSDVPFSCAAAVPLARAGAKSCARFPLGDLVCHGIPNERLPFKSKTAAMFGALGPGDLAMAARKLPRQVDSTQGCHSTRRSSETRSSGHSTPGCQN